MDKVEFNKLIVTADGEHEFIIEGNYEVDQEDLEIEFYTRNETSDWFIEALKGGVKLSEVKFINNESEKIFEVNKVVQVIEYFITLSRK